MFFVCHKLVNRIPIKNRIRLDRSDIRLHDALVELLTFIYGFIYGSTARIYLRKTDLEKIFFYNFGNFKLQTICLRQLELG